jgi:hypothetical protein
MTSLPTDEFAAVVGLDWAAAKHDVCLQAADSETREFSVLAHTPEPIDAWVSTLRTRFKGQPIAICLELNKGPIGDAPESTTTSCAFPAIPSRSQGTVKPSHPATPRTTPPTLSSSSNSCSSIAISSRP